MINDKISVIIPNYNSGPYLKQAIESALRQTIENLEILVVDDHSTDGSFHDAKELAEKDPRVKIFQTKSNSGGPATPRNLGLEKATGEWVAFLDGDDIWHPKKLELQIKLHETHGFEFISTYKLDFKAVENIPSKINLTNDFRLLSYYSILKKDFINTSSVLIKKSLLDSLRFSTRKDFVAVEDYDLWLKVLKKNSQVAICKSQLMYYRLTEGISSSKFKQAKRVFNLLRTHIKGRGKLLFYFSCYATLSIIYLKRVR